MPEWPSRAPTSPRFILPQRFRPVQPNRLRQRSPRWTIAPTDMCYDLMVIRALQARLCQGCVCLIDLRMHLSSLHIENFRGIASLSIPQLGAVTLITGKNGSGKSTILDAVRTYAARGQHSTVRRILAANDEYNSQPQDQDTDKNEFSRPSGPWDMPVNWKALFHGRHATHNSTATIGPTDESNQLIIRAISLENNSGDAVLDFLADLGVDPHYHSDVMLLERSIGSHSHVMPETLFFNEDVPSSESLQVMIELEFLTRRRLKSFKVRSENQTFPSNISCRTLGPEVTSNFQLAALWDHVALTPEEEHAMQSFQLVTDYELERVAVIGDRIRRNPRRVVVKTKQHQHPVPLKSFGDGAVRMFGFALALARARNSFLVLDEVENGIHHTIAEPFWRMIFESSKRHNIQVFATTHSWDCVVGFASALDDQNEAVGGLVRVDRLDDNAMAIVYSMREICRIAEGGVEVR